MVENYGHGSWLDMGADVDLANNQGTYNPAFEHNGKANVCFMDGHCQPLPKLKIPCYTTYPDATGATRLNTWFCRGERPNTASGAKTIPGL